MNYQTFYKRNAGLLEVGFNVGTVYTVSNGKYAINIFEDYGVLSDSQVISDVMMGNYCITNPEIFINADFTKVKTTNAKEYYEKKKAKKLGLEEENYKIRQEILNYASTLPKNKIVLYHGSKHGINGNIDVNYSNAICDFGKGFYLGDNIFQAENRVQNDTNPVLYAYEYTFGSCKELNLNLFDAVTWALYVGFNRNKVKATESIKNLVRETKNSDIVIGLIADDKMSKVFAEFLSGALTDVALANCLKFVQYGNQYVFKNERAINCLSYLGKYTVTEHMKQEAKRIHDAQKRQVEIYIEKQKKENPVGRRVYEYADVGRQ